MRMLTLSNVSIHDVVTSLNLCIAPGQRLGLIGESGSGKTLTALSIMRLIDSDGEITFHDQKLHELSERQLCSIRGKKIAMIFQEPMTALNPLMTIGAQLSEAIRIHEPVSRRVAQQRAMELLARVELADPAFMRRYPHELSGGQRQRVLIAMAVAHKPDVLICDEPTTALDVTSQRAIIDLILKVVAENNTALLFITHDLGLVARTCDDVVVLKKGVVVERGPVAQVLHAPKHEYTRMLVEASKLPQARARSEFGPELIRLENVSKRFHRSFEAVKDVSISVSRGQRVGIVGGSGSGKTTVLKMIAGLEKPTSGTVQCAADLQMVFQDPYGSLNPRMRVGDIIAETLPSYDPVRVNEVLTQVGLEPAMAQRFPHEFSGGQRQRISLARAIAPRPAILLADEPVSALDVSVRKKVLALLDELVSEYDLTLVFVSHDMDVVRSVCTDVVVMCDGVVVEQGVVEEVLDSPAHPYTRSLIDAVVHL
ncbi:ABC transporter ATP-binding protein [Corynebacterium felinum]|nr:ABC transporter ATP-binding protein [Corynebacterium felinum]MDF5821405.1 ABC transporter ATP-binding protein [Corynebacterium felinum]